MTEPNYTRDLLLRIKNGNPIFQTISAESASKMGIKPEETLTESEAKRVREHIDALERNGLIEIEFRSGAGFVTVRRLTPYGRDYLARAGSA